MKNEFTISCKAREIYGFHGVIKLPNPDLNVIRELALAMNKTGKPQVKAGDIHALVIITGIFHHIIDYYKEQIDSLSLSDALNYLREHLGKDEIAIFLSKLRKDLTLPSPRDEALIETALVNCLAGLNPAMEPYRDLFSSSYPGLSKLCVTLEKFFKTRPGLGPDKLDLIEFLKKPAQKAPASLESQLRFIHRNWSAWLGPYSNQLLSALDIIKEENKSGFLGPGPSEIYRFSDIDLNEYESFSPDTDWMPRLILIAKSTHVWLDQLSKKYQRTISKLDQIPDEELDILAHWGFTGLWLIGLWERSPASRKIKQQTGNPEAIASAYSIYDYYISGDLGGQPALDNLKERAFSRGIRLVGDMVPNHMSLDSNWVAEHPDWFVSLDEPPFPSYTFNGTDLSSHSDVSIYLEDHYYNRSDAAVVFKRSHRKTGAIHYIYHGNDGTAMPWNDTAQLDYLNPQVQEAVIDTIITVAKTFPVIRFDAAMTLTQRHFQRLWYPEPGTGGDIPSRAERGMSKQEFLRRMPQEFWRKVVDRLAREMPDTLLLAEAFWMMEPYFVRTLGMHRVYNSAFMNFLKMEENHKFRDSIKNTLEFNPEILKRFVNFMNNPDEETAIAQFGNGDKYFGVCTLLVTLPGLPMFGHGQVEGFSEKYGMEYTRAYRDESPDKELVRRHETEIFPLMHRRFLFAEVDHFRLYDFVHSQGEIDENVIAYSNCYQGKHSLVLVHNAFASTSGWLKKSVPNSTDLAKNLELSRDENHYIIFRDHFNGLEYIRACRQVHEQGMYFQLQAYGKHLFLDFRQVEDLKTGIYRELTSMLEGKGVPGISEFLRKHLQNPLTAPFTGIVNQQVYQELSNSRADKFPGDLNEKIDDLIAGVKALLGKTNLTSTSLKEELKYLFQLEIKPKASRAAGSLAGYFTHNPLGKAIGFVHIMTRGLGRLWLEEDWLLDEGVVGLYKDLGLDEHAAQRLVLLGKVLTRYKDWGEKSAKGQKESERRSFLTGFFQDKDVQKVIGVNKHRGETWFHKESLEELSHLMLLPSLLEFGDQREDNSLHSYSSLNRMAAMIRYLKSASRYSKYKLESLVEVLKTGIKPLS